MEKMIESATSAYIPKVEERAKARKAELEDMKVKVRTNPEQVEEWFDKEIDKLQNIDIKEIMKNATAGIWTRVTRLAIWCPRPNWTTVARKLTTLQGYLKRTCLQKQYYCSVTSTFCDIVALDFFHHWCKRNQITTMAVIGINYDVVV